MEMPRYDPTSFFISLSSFNISSHDTGDMLTNNMHKGVSIPMDTRTSKCKYVASTYTHFISDYSFHVKEGCYNEAANTKSIAFAHSINLMKSCDVTRMFKALSSTRVTK